MKTSTNQLSLPSPPAVVFEKRKTSRTKATKSISPFKKEAACLEEELLYMEEETERLNKLMNINRQAMGHRKFIELSNQINILKKSNLRPLSSGVALLNKDIAILKMGKHQSTEQLEQDLNKLQFLLKETISSFRKVARMCLIELTENYPVRFF